MNIDFQQCLLNIRNSGLPLQQLAKLIGHRDKGQYLNRIARGESKRMEIVTGLKLLDVHLDRCREKHQELAQG